MTTRASIRLVAFTSLAPLTLTAQGLPLKYVGPPTVAAIAPGDLMTRLYAFADDSMMGRVVGTEHNNRATAYIEREVRRLGLVPGGDGGEYFQYLPLYVRTFDTTSILRVGDTIFKPGVDFIAASAVSSPGQFRGQIAIYGGTVLDTASALTPEMTRGRIVVLRQFRPPRGMNQAALDALQRTPQARSYFQAIEVAAGTIFIGPDEFSPAAIRAAISPSGVMFRREGTTPVALTVTTRVAEAMLGTSLSTVAKGAVGKPITTDIRFIDAPRPFGRNVVAIVPGTDPKLKGQYVAIGAHSDHIGFRPNNPIDHDSVKSFMQVVRPQGADNPYAQATPEQTARVQTLTDSLRAAHGGPRPDSIANGADDDGSGTVSALEIAEAFAKGTIKPNRSILFVWHTGEETGMWGSEWFTDHPTVPRDSIVAQLNMDMIGRGAARDVTGTTVEGALLHGGSGYVQLVGSRRLSTELGDLVERVNRDEKLGMTFDYAMDANGHPQEIYCRSDHYEYARYGIPIVFFTTGGHADYHQFTDEPQYIDYENMARVNRLVFATALRVANLDHRVVVDKPKPDPKGHCTQ